MDRQGYMEEANRQLSERAFYEPLQVHPTKSYKKKLSTMLRTMNRGVQERIMSATTSDPRPGIFYLLPKIHKQGNPGRPIISGINTITEGVSGYLDSILRPLAVSAASFVQDTTDFLSRLHALGDLPENILLATMDVKALYTNIPHCDGLQAIKDSLSDVQVGEAACDLAKFVLEHNYFSFGSCFYWQCSGTAMGTKMAPNYANVFMSRLEEQFLGQCQLEPFLYLRYIDDIFIIWHHGRATLEIFLNSFNSFHSTIKFTHEISSQTVNFLDVKVSVASRRLSTTLYRKPTDVVSYLHHKSFHPPGTFKSVVHSQLLRLKRICSSESDFKSESDQLCQTFLGLNYDPLVISTQLSRIEKIPREDLLEYKNKQSTGRIPLVLTFTPQILKIRSIARELQPLLTADERLGKIFPQPPILALRQPRNIGQGIIRSSLPGPGATANCTNPCGSGRCQLCRHINTSDHVRAPNGQTAWVRGSFHCNSVNVVYAISCRVCDSIYIGQTGRSLRDRLNNHKSDIRRNDTSKPVSEHFCSAGHSLADLLVCVLRGGIFTNRRSRETEESRLISRLGTIATGMNVARGSLLAHFKL